MDKQGQVVEGPNRRKNIAGRRFGKLIAIRDIGTKYRTHRLWLCQCDCGKSCEVIMQSLVRGRTKSCGCNWHVDHRADITGQRFGRLIALGDIGARKKSRLWACVCDCGQHVEVTYKLLVTGKTRSCGCLMRDTRKTACRTHGGTHLPEYSTWSGAIERCYNEHCIAYPGYGGRGIKVCERWRESFENFYQDMGPRPSEKHSLDRIDNNGDYEPGNCRWATQKQQMRNTRKSLMLEMDGEVKCLAEWCEIYGVKYGKAFYHIQRGRSLKVALGIAENQV
jgi:hypothetical protein